ncbi:SVEP1-like protein, partial [Mya arenaria]
CSTPPSVLNGNPVYTLTTYQETVSYTCNRGYFNSSGDKELTCGSTGSWEGTHPVCTIYDCEDLSNITNGMVNVSGGTQYGDNATYTCTTGYFINSGYAPRVCEHDCQTPTSNSNSSFTLTSGTTTYLSVVTYTCDDGFFQTGGSVSRTCQDGGSWDGSAILCQIHDCNAPDSVANGIANYTLTTYQEKVSYTCNRGYYRSSGDEELTCGSTGSWNGTVPTCTIH